MAVHSQPSSRFLPSCSSLKTALSPSYSILLLVVRILLLLVVILQLLLAPRTPCPRTRLHLPLPQLAKAERLALLPQSVRPQSLRGSFRYVSFSRCPVQLPPAADHLVQNLNASVPASARAVPISGPVPATVLMCSSDAAPDNAATLLPSQLPTHTQTYIVVANDESSTRQRPPASAATIRCYCYDQPSTQRASLLSTKTLPSAFPPSDPVLAAPPHQ